MSDLGVVGFIGVAAALLGLVEPHIVLTAHDKYGCYDLATACDGAGVEVVLYDIDPGTLGPAWDSLERVLDERVAAVVVAHLFDMPVELALTQVAVDVWLPCFRRAGD